jgi:hypothetical protein
MSTASASALTPKEQAEQEDRKLLAKTNQDIQGIMQLLSDGNTREVIKQKVKEAREKIKTKGQRMVFHPYGGKKPPVSQEASNFLALGDALELMLAASQHNSDLLKALSTSSKKRVEVLERLIKSHATGSGG